MQSHWVNKKNYVALINHKTVLGMINPILLTNHVSLEFEDWKRNQLEEVLVFKFLTKNEESNGD